MKIDTMNTEVDDDGQILRTCNVKVMLTKCKRHCKTFLRSKEDDKDVKIGYDGKMLSPNRRTPANMKFIPDLFF